MSLPPPLTPVLPLLPLSPTPRRRPGGIQRLRALALLGLVAALSGCGGWSERVRGSESLFGIVTPYRMEIVQGNVVTREQADAVKPGMGREQVRDILGSPMLADPFHADRWDYVFTIRRQGTEPQRRSVVAWFKDDRLERVDAPDLPTEQEFVASISRPRPGAARELPVLELSDEQRKALPRPPSPAEPPRPANAAGEVRPYPPLERDQ